MLISPSDHVIPNRAAFHQAIVKGLEQTKTKKIVTFGIKPTRPETGYGYLECMQAPRSQAVKVKNFIEKPDLTTATSIFKSSRFLWNSGIFLFRADEILRAFKLHAADVIEPASNAIRNAIADLGFLRLQKDAWEKIRKISIDYAVMEHAKNLVAIPFLEDWTDLGDWDAVWHKQNPDQNGLVVSQNATAIDCNNCLIRSETKSQHIVGLGLNNIIAVAMTDAVLVVDKSRSQDVKRIVSTLRNKSIPQAETASKDHRPWGWFETLIIQESFRVKRIFIKPGAALSLQSHKYRSEHWIVVEVIATVTIDNQITTLRHSEAIYVPRGSLHRLTNTEKMPVELIEIQIGSYLGEDDIVRYADRYARSNED